MSYSWVAISSQDIFIECMSCLQHSLNHFLSCMFSIFAFCMLLHDINYKNSKLIKKLLSQIVIFKLKF